MKPLLFILVAFSLAACSVVQPTRLPTITEPNVPTHTNSPISTSAPPTRPVPTAAAPLTQPVPTLTPAPSITPHGTLESSWALFAEKCRGYYFQTSFVSPTLEWAICRDAQKIVAVNRADVRWEFGVTAAYGLPYFESEVDPLFWSPDNQYVFIKSYSAWDGGYMFGTTHAIWRMDLRTGQVSEIIKPRVTDGYLGGAPYAVSISPTGRRLVYIQQEVSPLTLIVADIQTGETQEIELQSRFEGAGIFFWSPDGTKLLFKLGGPYRSEDGEPTYFSMMLVDFTDFSHAIVLDQVFQYIDKVEMTDEAATMTGADGKQWHFDFASEVLKDGN